MTLRICALLLHHGPKQKGHHWEQGKPLPDLKVVALIEQYATLTDALPVRVHELRAQVEKERRLADLEEVRIKERWEELKKEKEKREKDKEKVEKERLFPPWKRARSSRSPASLSPALPPEEGIEEEPKPEQLENKEKGWQSLSSYSEDAEEEAAPKPVDHMAFPEPWHEGDPRVHKPELALPFKEPQCGGACS